MISQDNDLKYYITSTAFTWFFCYDTDHYNDHCIEEMKITFQNRSTFHISKITFTLTIKEKSEINNIRIIYKKKHTVIIDLGPEEVADCEKFQLNNEVNTMKKASDENLIFDTEIINVK
jgi:hypothetical protein